MKRSIRKIKETMEGKGMKHYQIYVDGRLVFEGRAMQRRVKRAFEELSAKYQVKVYRGCERKLYLEN